MTWWIWWKFYILVGKRSSFTFVTQVGRKNIIYRAGGGRNNTSSVIKTVAKARGPQSLAVHKLCGFYNCKCPQENSLSGFSQAEPALVRVLTVKQPATVVSHGMGMENERLPLQSQSSRSISWALRLFLFALQIPPWSKEPRERRAMEKGAGSISSAFAYKICSSNAFISLCLG